MKLFSVILFGLVTLSAASCSKKSNDDAVIPNTPRTEVPDELVGQWLNGNFSMSNWWTYDGQYAGNPYSSSRAFTLAKNGDAEFFQVIKTYDGSCSTDAFTYYKGTVKFEEDGSFTFYPQQGNYRGFYSCTPGSNFERAPFKNELKPFKLYWSNEVDESGREWLVTRFGKNDPETEASYFAPSEF